MTDPFRALPEPLRVHILLHVACQADDRTLMRMIRVFRSLRAFLKANRGAMLELMDALTVPRTTPTVTTWIFCDKRHRGGGLPAVEDVGRMKAWYVDGKRHRGGGLPAIEWADEYKVWWVDGKRHRDGGLPAVEWPNGDKEWWVDGKRHRGGGLPAFEHVDGSKEWWVNDKRHRGGGLPAIEFVSGKKEWWIEGIQQPAPVAESGKRRQ